jgi:hypothetical protein
MVFENSTACVYVETCSARFGVPGRTKTCLGPSGPDFELKLKVKACSFGSNHFFTESLILAQDERWRRA